MYTYGCTPREQQTAISIAMSHQIGCIVGFKGGVDMVTGYTCIDNDSTSSSCSYHDLTLTNVQTRINLVRDICAQEIISHAHEIISRVHNITPPIPP